MLLSVRASNVLRANRKTQLLRRERDEIRGDHRAVVRMPAMSAPGAAQAPKGDARDHEATDRSEVNWSAFYARLHSFVSARVRSASDVDDLVQLILERAMSKSTGAEIHNAPGWLFGIARNAVADHFRAQARALLTDADTLDTAAPLGPPSRNAWK